MSNRESLKQWGQELAKYRLAKQLTQAELSEKTRLSQGTISHAETGENVIRPGTYKVLKKYLPDLPPPPFYSKQAETPEQTRIEQLASELATARLRIQALEFQVQELQGENASLRQENMQLRAQLVQTRATARKSQEAQAILETRTEVLTVPHRMLPPPSLPEVIYPSRSAARSEPQPISSTPSDPSRPFLQPILIMLDQPTLKRIGRFLVPFALVLGFGLGMASSPCSGGSAEVEEKKCDNPAQTWDEAAGACVDDPTKSPTGGKMPDCRKNGNEKPCCNPEKQDCQNL